MSIEIAVLKLFFNEYYNLEEISLICCMSIDDVNKILAHYIKHYKNTDIPNIII